MIIFGISFGQISMALNNSNIDSNVVCYWHMICDQLIFQMKVSIVSAYPKWKKKKSFLICEIRKKKVFLTYFNRMIHSLAHCYGGMLKHNLQSTLNKSAIK